MTTLRLCSKRRRLPGAGLAVCGILVTALASGASGEPASAAVGAEVGQELQKIRREVLDAKPAPDKKTPGVKLETGATESAAAGGADNAPTFEITRLDLQGDAALLSRLKLAKKLEAATVGSRLTEARIRALAGEYQALLVKEGYYLARIAVPPQDFSGGVLVYRVDQGRIGTKTFFMDEGGRKVPYRGRYYGLPQLEARLAGQREGEAFKYPDFYRDFYRLNAHPDLTVNADLRVRTEAAEGMERRYVDMALNVEESLPLHGVLSLNNEGTDVTDTWGAGLALQYLNLTRHDDVLSLTAPVSLDLKSIRSVAGSYYLPHGIFKGGSWTVFGGYSKIDAADLVPNVNLDGKGWFSGAQAAFNVFSGARRQMSLSLGLVHSVIEDNLLLDEAEVMPREVRLSPVNLGASCVEFAPDTLGGRNSLSLIASLHSGGFLDASDDEEFQVQRAGSKADYVKVRLLASRIQPLFRMHGDDNKRWILYGLLDAQTADEPLIPAEQKPSVARGYEVREFLADEGVSGTLELRTPLIGSALLPRLLSRPGDGKDNEKLQLVSFLDGAYLSVKDALPGEDEDTTLLSAGLGFRLSLGSHFQARFDWGWPLEKTVESDSGGRGHLGIELQF